MQQRRAPSVPAKLPPPALPSQSSAHRLRKVPAHVKQGVHGVEGDVERGAEGLQQLEGHAAHLVKVSFHHVTEHGLHTGALVGYRVGVDGVWGLRPGCMTSETAGGVG